LLLERITVSDSEEPNSGLQTNGKTSWDKPFTQWLENASPDIRDVYESLRQAILSQGEDVSEKQTKLYTAFKRIKNFATVTYANKTELNLYLHIDPKQVELRDGLRDMSTIGHWGTGELEVRIKTQEDVKQSLSLIQRSYEGQL